MKGAPDAGRRGGWYYGWNVVALCSLSGVALNLLPINCFSLFLRGWAAQLHAPVSVLQLGMLVMGIGTALLSPLAGVIIDRWPARWLFAGGLVCNTLFYFAISGVTQVWQFLTLFALVLPMALLLSGALIANTLIARWFVRRLGLALSANMVGPGVIGILLPPIVATLIPVLGWSRLWQIGGAAMGLIILPVIVLLLREWPTEREGLHYVGGYKAPALVAPAVPTALPGSGPQWRQILSRRMFWLLVLVYVPMLALYLGCMANTAPVVAALGLKREFAGVLLSIASLSHVVSLLLVGMLSDRFGNRLPMAGLAFATAAGGVLFAIGQRPEVLSAAMLLVGCGASFWSILASAIAREFGVATVGRAFGLASFFIPVASIAPFAIARLQESTGSFTPAFAALSVLCAMGGAIWMLGVER
jgi:MFS family permease